MDVQTVDCFPSQLRKARLFRGYQKQASICNRIGISRQIWSLWELGKRFPNLEKLTTLSNFLQINISYFFLESAEPENYTID